MTPEQIAALLAEIRSQGLAPDGKTSEEWAPIFGVRDLKTVRRRLRALIGAGHVEHCTVERQNMAGIPQSTHGYRLVKP